MAEAVRLVVWDLDETFWKGTLTEGGIEEYVRAHHDIVIELARRGIMSSICSKNTPADVIPILEREGIADYFIFPSISWEPKGMRLAQLVETVQLRAPTVMFIDDNPNNRGEAVAIVPGLQIEDETFIPKMLDDPRFKGKEDKDLSRLRQYKLLEERKRDEEQTKGGNEAFLRGCDIRIHIEYDVESHLDRAIELINRTNQLNFTKRRLPEDILLAREELKKSISGGFGRFAGLIQVADKYGDYGFVGFFLRAGMRHVVDGQVATASLLHFCFSCRTLGMGIEEWVYKRLGWPELQVVGEVLTDLTQRREIDWVREVGSIADTSVADEPLAPQIVLHGGCETAVLGLYLQRLTKQLDVHGSYVANGIFVSGNVASYVANIPDRDPASFAEECQTLGLAAEAEMGDVFSEAQQGALFVANFASDAGAGFRIRHKKYGWIFQLSPDGLNGAFPLSEEALEAQLEANRDQLSAARVDEIKRINRHLATNYEVLPERTDNEAAEEIREVARRIPQGSRFIIILPHDQERWNGTIKEMPSMLAYAQLAERAIAEFPYATTVRIGDVLQGTDEIADVNHYVREVYVRLADRIREIAPEIPAREDSHVARNLPAPAQLLPLRSPELIYTSDTIRVTRNFAGTPDQIVVAFQSWNPEPSFDVPPFGDGFLHELGVAGVFVTVSANHWYQTPDMGAAVAAILRVTNGASLLLYGSSMGGYAALLYSGPLKAKTVLAISPQYSIDREKVPFEQRWAEEAASLRFDRDSMATSLNLEANIVVLYDSCTQDALHARATGEHGSNVKLVPVPFGGHPVFDVLLDTKVMKRIFNGLLTGRMGSLEIRDLIRRECRQSPLYWAAMGRKIFRRHPERAIKCLARAETLELSNPRLGHPIGHLRHLIEHELPDDLRPLLRAIEEKTQALDFDVAQGGNGDQILGRGWATAEGDGCWALGDVSELMLPLSPRYDGALIVTIHVPFLFLMGDVKAQELIIVAGQHQLFRQRLTESEVIRLEIPREALPTIAKPNDDHIVLYLLHPDAISPKDVGLNPDKRRLSLMIRKIGIRYVD